jgi:hypothetical protein
VMAVMGGWVVVWWLVVGGWLEGLERWGDALVNKNYRYAKPPGQESSTSRSRLFADLKHANCLTVWIHRNQSLHDPNTAVRQTTSCVRARISSEATTTSLVIL